MQPLVLKQKESRTSTIVFKRLSVSFGFFDWHVQQENVDRRTLQTRADGVDLLFFEIDKIAIESTDKDSIELVAVNQFGGITGFNPEERRDVVRISRRQMAKRVVQEF